MSDLAKRPVGAPPIPFDQEIADAICHELANSDIGLRTLLESNPEWPGITVITQWRFKHPEFHANLARARVAKAEFVADQIIQLSDTPWLAQRRRLRADGTEEIVEYDNTERTKLAMTARQWAAGKWDPTRFGERIEHEHNNKVNLVIVGSVLDEEPRDVRGCNSESGKSWREIVGENKAKITSDNAHSVNSGTDELPQG